MIASMMSSRRANCSQCRHQTTQPEVRAAVITTNALRINVPLPYEHITAPEIKATATPDITEMPVREYNNRLANLPIPTPKF